MNYSYKRYPDAIAPDKVGQYDLHAYSGGGYFYDDILEYRVWVTPKNNDEELKCYSFSNYKDAKKFSKINKAEQPLALVYQKEYIDEPEPGKFVWVKKPRITEWQVEWLPNNKDTLKQIPAYLAKRSKK